MYTLRFNQQLRLFSIFLAYAMSASALAGSKKSATDKSFADYAEEAIAQCKAFATDKKSSLPAKDDDSVSAFFDRYKSDYVEGEPGEVSATFSSNEKEDLYTELEQSESPANTTMETKQSYCALYAKYLRSRY